MTATCSIARPAFNDALVEATVEGRTSGEPFTSPWGRHFVIQVEALHATVAQLAARGVQAERPGSPDGSADFWTAWVTDPDGYHIELVQWPGGHPEAMTRSDLADPGQSR